MSGKDGGEPGPFRSGAARSGAARSGAARSGAARGLSRQRLAIAGLAGLAVLGGGAYLVTSQAGGDGGTTANRDVGVVVPSVDQGAGTTSATPAAPVPTASAAPTTSAAAMASADAVAPTSATPSPRVTTKATRERDPAAVRREILQAREKAAKDGVKLQRPPKSRGKALAPNLVSTRTQQIAGGSIRITTAPGDLTGQADQLLAGDKGTRTGSARCTQNVRFSASAPARKMPTMLLCWRTSASRSVVTLAAAKNGKPSAAASVAVIDREWAKLR